MITKRNVNRLKILFAACFAVCCLETCSSAADWWNPSWKGRVKLTVQNGTGQTAAKVPLWLSVKALGVPAADIGASVRLVSSDGREYPSQVDDLNRNGKTDDGDEVSLLADIAPGENTFYLYYAGPESAKPESFASYTEEKGTASLDNGIVKIQLTGWKDAPAKQTLMRDASQGWLNIATQYYDEIKLDDVLGNYNIDRKDLSLISNGPARVILRQTWEMTENESGKRVDRYQEWHFFPGRPEILASKSYVNQSRDKAMVVTQLTSGFYNVTPGGRFDYSTDKFAAEDAGRVLTDTFANGSINLKVPSGRPVWYDAYCAGSGKPQVGLGCVPILPPTPNMLVVQDIGKGGSHQLRMTEYFLRPENQTVWPGKAYTLAKWYLLHTGDYTSVKSFSEFRRALSVKVAGVEKK